MTEEVRDIMACWQNPNADIPEKELEMLLNEQDKSAHLEAEMPQQANQRSVATTKVPIHVTLWIDQKTEDSVGFFLANVNGLYF